MKGKAKVGPLLGPDDFGKRYLREFLNFKNRGKDVGQMFNGLPTKSPLCFDDTRPMALPSHLGSCNDDGPSKDTHVGIPSSIKGSPTRVLKKIWKPIERSSSSQDPLRLLYDGLPAKGLSLWGIDFR